MVTVLCTGKVPVSWNANLSRTAATLKTGKWPRLDVAAVRLKLAFYGTGMSFSFPRVLGWLLTGEAQSRLLTGEAQSRLLTGEAQSRLLTGEAQSRRNLSARCSTCKNSRISLFLIINTLELEENGTVDTQHCTAQAKTGAQCRYKKCKNQCEIAYVRTSAK
jgi:hypothetical protein